MKLLFLLASILDYTKPFTHTTGCCAPKNIDYIYLINLDQRPERRQNCLMQLSHYEIYPQRFPAIYGWTLPTLDGIGITGLDGKTTFSTWTSLGAIGCTLSHLSVLKDAYERGYETVWVMEDDIIVHQDPHRLTQLIEKLDALADWDVLYTDCDYMQGIDPNKNLAAQLPWMWRPDTFTFDLQQLLEYTPVGDDFAKIGCRIRAHSIIYRRAGIKKILDFYESCNMYIPYDWEIALVPDIQLYILNHGVVGARETTSDTKIKHFP